ncbi:hypothetical protein [Paraliomyxa miuraensis]|uniref:hypothetical protein n=1 Tax=Paraliomyxa miuraensis TaxID=376150 RepID=UPI0022530090|nr:hypothetical protein [Paraliomyxa miuraensis]MCX4244314.1 hypothetical protein [Paraliomyxa miuraensis]
MSSRPRDTTSPDEQPGHDPGRRAEGDSAGASEGFDWGSYVAWLAQRHGTLAAVADALAAQRGHAESVGTIERALRRLRARQGRDGGTWGARVLRAFGVPDDVDSRVRWMGQYHTRFSDLPRSLCLELLRPWDRPPVSESPSRAWVQLGLAGVALRGREQELAREHLRRAERAAEGLARLEWLLASSFAISREEPRQAQARVEEAERLLGRLEMSADDRACYRARCVDHHGWHDNVVRRDHAAARARYEELPRDGPPFGRVRRDNGLGWSLLRLGDREGAHACAVRAVEAAGDGGSLRLRAMALSLLAATLEGQAAEAARQRAKAIAERLDDEALRVRLDRRRG